MTPRDYRAKGGGADDAEALQRWIDHGGGELDGVYLSSKPLILHDRTRIDGVHPSLSQLVAHPFFAGGVFITNSNQERTAGKHHVRDIRLSNFAIVGNEALRDAKAKT